MENSPIKKPLKIKSKKNISKISKNLEYLNEYYIELVELTKKLLYKNKTLTKQIQVLKLNDIIYDFYQCGIEIIEEFNKDFF